MKDDEWFDEDECNLYDKLTISLGGGAGKVVGMAGVVRKAQATSLCNR